jgi:hypothetical protein
VVNPEPYPTLPELLDVMGQNGGYPLVNVYIANWKITIFMAMFNSYSYVYQRVPSIFLMGPMGIPR